MMAKTKTLEITLNIFFTISHGTFFHHGLAQNSLIHSFIQSGYFYSASSSPLLPRGAPNTAWILCRSLILKCHRLRVKDLPKVTTWRLERYSNPQPFGWKPTNLTTEPPCPTMKNHLRFWQVKRILIITSRILLWNEGSQALLISQFTPCLDSHEKGQYVWRRLERTTAARSKILTDAARQRYSLHHRG